MEDNSDDSEESWVTLNLSASSQHRLEPHSISWQPSATAKNAPNPDELYDPEADEKDEAWIENAFGQERKTTDAVLSCAGCFTTVCFVSRQYMSHGRHLYKANQAINCRVVSEDQIKNGRKRQCAPSTALHSSTSRKRLQTASNYSIKTSQDSLTESNGSIQEICNPSDTQSTIENDDATCRPQVSGAIQCLYCSSIIGTYEHSKSYYVFNEVLPTR